MTKNPLRASEVDGNTLNIGIDDDVDVYHCKECDKNVAEDEFNHKRGMCYGCWWKI